MSTMLWYLGAGFLLGWIMSTLTEWLWFRRRRSRPAPIDRAGRREARPSGPEIPPLAEALPQPVGSDAAYRPYRPRRDEESADAMPSAPAREPNAAAVSPAEANEEPAVAGTRQAPVTPAWSPDPLSKIRGVGVVYERRLYEAGIFTWHQLAQTDVAQLRTATHAHSSSDPAAWREEARRLAVENNRVGVIYSGPVPDKFTYIDGLGAQYEQELYQAGILTYGQLAALSPQVLARILPSSGAVGDDIDFQLWIEQAAQLSEHA